MVVVFCFSITSADQLAKQLVMCCRSRCSEPTHCARISRLAGGR